MRNKVIKHMVQQGALRLASQNLMKFVKKDSEFRRIIRPGDYFGNLTETVGTGYQRQWVVSLSSELNVIRISNQSIRDIFIVQMNEENFDLLKKSLGIGTTVKRVRNLSRCFQEKEFGAGHVLMEEGKPIKKIYLIKSGEA